MKKMPRIIRLFDVMHIYRDSCIFYFFRILLLKKQEKGVF